MGFCSMKCPKDEGSGSGSLCLAELRAWFLISCALDLIRVLKCPSWMWARLLWNFLKFGMVPGHGSVLPSSLLLAQSWGEWLGGCWWNTAWHDGLSWDVFNKIWLWMLHWSPVSSGGGIKGSRGMQHWMDSWDLQGCSDGDRRLCPLGVNVPPTPEEVWGAGQDKQPPTAAFLPCPAFLRARKENFSSSCLGRWCWGCWALPCKLSGGFARNDIICWADFFVRELSNLRHERHRNPPCSPGAEEARLHCQSLQHALLIYHSWHRVCFMTNELNHNSHSGIHRKICRITIAAGRENQT